jgi:hypothetical protein
LDHFTINDEHTEQDLIQRAERETGIPAKEIQVRDSAGRRITNPVQGATAWIHYGGLKGGRTEVEIILQFELKTHHLWVWEREHIRDIMLRKRYDKTVVAPMGLKGKLEGPWQSKQVIKLGRRPDVQGHPPARLPKEVPVWNPNSEKVMLWMDVEGNGTRAKFVPKEMPPKEVLKKFRLVRKQLVIKDASQPPWRNWQTIKTTFRPFFTGCWELPNPQAQLEKTIQKSDHRRNELCAIKRKLAEEEAYARDQLYAGCNIVELEKAKTDLVKQMTVRPKGDLVVIVKAGGEDTEAIVQQTVMNENDDLMEVIRKARFNPKEYKLNIEARPPWKEGQVIWLGANRKSVHWNDECKRTFTQEERMGHDRNEMYMRVFDDLIEKRKQAEADRKAQLSAEQRQAERQAEIDAMV